MKTPRLLALAVIPLLIACTPKKPEISLPEVPARPLMEALEHRREQFSGLKAVASVETVRSGRRRSYDTVGIVLDGQRRFRAEAYGPLGQSLATLVGDGAEVLLRLDDGRVVRPGAAGIERIFGAPMDTTELCSVLTGNLPAIASSLTPRAYQEPDGTLLIELREGALLRRFFVLLPNADTGQDIRITASELYRSGKLVYRVWYEAIERSSQYLIAKKVNLENPGEKASLTVLFYDLEVNVPLADDAFILPEGNAGVR